VNVAARLEQFAEPGGICVSQTVYDQVRKIIEIPFQDIGERRLKNISNPVHVYRIAPGELSWPRRLFSRANIRLGLGVAAGAVALFLAVAVGSFYLRQPASLWDAVLGNAIELPEHPALAVLPFDDMSATHDQQYLADGITEDLITSLAKIPELLVMARTASFAYKDKPADIRQVGKDLQVHYIVDGSIQRSDHDLRVSAQLIDAATGRELWAENYDRQIENIFAIRDDIARSIAGTIGGLSGKLAKAEVVRLSGKDPNSFTAYDYLMRGWYEWH
jgi:TolB-like protein